MAVQVKQAKLKLLQRASTEQIQKLLCTADPEKLAHCLEVAASTGLSSSLVQQIQQVQAATVGMQRALDAAKVLQVSNSSCSSQTDAVDAATVSLAAALRKFEAMCKPSKHRSTRSCSTARKNFLRPEAAASPHCIYLCCSWCWCVVMCMVLKSIQAQGASCW